MGDAALKARREAYDKALQSCGLLHQQILRILAAHPAGLTRAEIARLGQIKLQTVCGRVSELKAKQLVRELDERRMVDGSSASVLVTCQPPEPPPTLFDDQQDDGSYFRKGM